MPNEQRAERALRRFLQNERAFALALCHNYDVHEKQGRLCLAPDGLGGWSLVHTDTHPLALALPLLNEEQFTQLRQEQEVQAILQPFAEQILQAWSRIAFIANEGSNPFLNPGATDF